MSDALKLALRISAIDLFSGVLRHFREEIAGTGAAAKAMQRDYDALVSHAASGMKALAVGGYIAEKMKPAVEASGDFQENLLAIKAILQGAHPEAAKLADEMGRVRDNAMAVSKELKFPAEQVLEATRLFIQAGVPLGAILDHTDKQGHVQHGSAYMADLLAETRHLDLATTTENIAKIAHGFQVPETGYGAMTDSIAKAMNLGSASPSELFYTLNQAGAVAHNMGHMDVQQTAVLGQALAPLGGEAAAGMKSLITALTGAQVRGYKWQQKTGFDFFDKQGKSIGVDASLKLINEKIKGMTDKQKFFVLGRDFGQGGLNAILLALAVGKPGVKSYPEMEADYWKQAGLVQQNAVVSQGYNFQKEKLDAEKKNLYVALFQPLTDALGDATHSVNEFAGSMTSFAVAHPAVAKITSGAVGAGLVVAGSLAAYHGVRAAGGAAGMLKNLLKKGGSLAGGVAEGKVLQEATGIAPVFVTNWPAGGVAGAADSIANTVAAKTESVVAARAVTGVVADGAEVAGASRAATWLGGAAEAGTGLGIAMVLSQAVKPIDDFFKPMREATERWAKASGDKSAMGYRSMSAPQLALLREIELKQMPEGKWAAAQPGHWWSSNQSPEAYDAAVTKLVRQLIPNGSTKPVTLEGKLEIKLDQSGRMMVSKVKTNQPNVQLDVGTMLGVP